MAWSDSRIFRAFLTDTLAGTAVFDLNAPSDTYKAALYNNSITPDRDATSANTAYNAGVWANSNEVSDGSEWAAGGQALDTLTITNPVSSVVMFDCADETSVGTSATLANVFGFLVYDDTKTTPVADQGVCFNYLGGTNSVTDGTFALIFNANGLWRITV